MSKTRKNNNSIKVEEDKYSASYWRKISDYQTSEQKLYDDVIKDIYGIINSESTYGRHFCSIPIYSINYKRKEFKVDTPTGTHIKSITLSKVKQFLISKGFKCKRNGIQLEIDWF